HRSTAHLQETGRRGLALTTKRTGSQQAVKYYVDTLGDKEASAVTEIERYCVWPGQACTYMLGKLAFLKERDRAKAALGRRFDPQIPRRHADGGGRAAGRAGRHHRPLYRGRQGVRPGYIPMGGARADRPGVLLSARDRHTAAKCAALQRRARR